MEIYLKTVVGLTLPLTQSQVTQLDAFSALFNSTSHSTYVNLVVKKLPINQLKSNCISTLNLNARHFNSIASSVKGKASSVLELKKLSIKNHQAKLDQFNKELKTIKNKISKFNKVKSNILPQLKSSFTVADRLVYSTRKKIKNKAIFLEKKIKYHNKRMEQLLHHVKDDNPQLCFGSKSLLKKQHTGYFANHEEWLAEWRFQRNKESLFVGSKDESSGNLNAQLSHLKDNQFKLLLNINPNAQSLKDRYIELIINLSYESETIKKIINNIKDKTDSLGRDIRQPLTYRITKEKNKKSYRYNQYKVSISFEKYLYPEIISQSVNAGVFSVDVNQDHLAVCELNNQGNYIDSWRLNFDATGSSHQNIASIAESVKSLVLRARKKNKAIVIEDLDFQKKKISLNSGINKKKNVQLSSFAYGKIKELIHARSKDAGLEVLEVNPAYTSIIGSLKYKQRQGISIHKSASMVIGRRGMKLKEKETVCQLELSESARNQISKLIGNTYWAAAQKHFKKENTKPIEK